jgi:CRP-like cAMP-binding protein
MIEPHNAYTVQRRPLMPHGGRTPAQTIATIRARFPDAFTSSGLAIPGKLAKLEDARRYGVKDSDPRGGISREACIRLADMRRAEGEKTVETILAAITEPMTADDIAQSTGLFPSTVIKALRRAHKDGRVVKSRLKKLTVWECKEGM